MVTYTLNVDYQMLEKNLKKGTLKKDIPWGLSIFRSILFDLIEIMWLSVNNANLGRYPVCMFVNITGTHHWPGVNDVTYSQDHTLQIDYVFLFCLWTCLHHTSVPDSRQLVDYKHC